MNDSLKAVSAEIEAYADEVFSGRKTLLQIERHLSRKGWEEENVSIMMRFIRDAVSRRKKVRDAISRRKKGNA